MKSAALKVLVVIAVVLSIGCVLFGKNDPITGEQAQRLVEGGARLIDVRTPEEFVAGHIQGAINIPVQELERRLAELEPKNKPIVLYCRSGNRSGRAARLLKGQGYTQVYDLGSMSRW